MFLSRFELVLKGTRNEEIENMAQSIREIRDRKGRLFVLGVGGSAANASHAVNDFRKLCGIKAYSPTDNVSELTAWINDDSWNNSYVQYLKSSFFNAKDALLILSVGGGSIEKNISVNLVNSAEYALDVGGKVFSIVGRAGDVNKLSDSIIFIPPYFPEHITPIVESIQSVILHLLVSHPLLKKSNTTW